MESRKVFQNRAYTAEIFQRLSELRESKLLCDITLLVNNIEIHAHKVVLVACSEYFKSLLAKNFKESQLKMIPLSDVNAEAVNLVVNYMYASSIQITMDNVFNLLHISRVWFVNTLLEECCQFLMNSIGISNALLAWTNARQIDHIEMKNKAEVFLGRHFTEIMRTDEFLELDSNALIELLSKDSLSVTSENQIYECAISWINHDQEKRKQHVLDIIGSIRMSLIERPYLINNVLKNELIKDNVQIINKVYTKIAEVAKERKEQDVNTFLLVMGGNLPEAQSSLEYYNFGTETWHKLPDIFGILAQATLTSINDKIYVIGKTNTNVSGGVPVIGKYDFAKEILYDCKSLTNLKTSFEQVVISNNFIYSFCNGFPGSLSVSEKIGLKTGTLTNIAAMNAARSEAAVCVLDQFIYVIGGNNFMTGTLKSVERYDPYEDVWKDLSDMNFPRKAAGVATINGLLYVVGGADKQNVFDVASVYNPKSNTWSEIISKMSVRRFQPAVVPYNNLLIVIGGTESISSNSDHFNQYNSYTHLLSNSNNTNTRFASSSNSNNTSNSNSTNSTDCIEVFNPENQTWDKNLIKSKMFVVRKGHGAIIIKTYNNHGRPQ